jgi:hypothetical protein
VLSNVCHLSGSKFDLANDPLNKKQESKPKVANDPLNKKQESKPKVANDPPNKKQECNEGKPWKKSYDNTKKFQTKWATKVPWAKVVVSKDGMIIMVKCRVYSLDVIVLNECFESLLFIKYFSN